jgi:hypothetical protein
MTTKLKPRIPSELRSALTVINNSLADVEIAKAVEQVGHLKMALMEGKRLSDIAIEAAIKLNDIKELLRKANEDKLTAKKIANEAYQKFYDTAKASFGKSILKSLGLKGVKFCETEGFISNVKMVFDHAAKMEQIQEVLSKAGFDQARLQADYTKIVTFEIALQTYWTAQNARKQAVQAKDISFNELKAWLEPYLNATMILFHDKQDMLVKLGIKSHKEPKKTPPMVKTPTPFDLIGPLIDTSTGSKIAISTNVSSSIS